MVAEVKNLQKLNRANSLKKKKKRKKSKMFKKSKFYKKTYELHRMCPKNLFVKVK